MAQLQIGTITDKISVIDIKIVEKEKCLKHLISTDNITKATMSQVKESLENIMNNNDLCNLDEKEIIIGNQIAEEIHHHLKLKLKNMKYQ